MIQMLSVSKRYDDGYYGLRDITFKVGPGKFVFLTGESGAGKSTVLRLIYRAERPTNGTILVDGADTAAAHGGSLTTLRRRMGMVFQDYMLPVSYTHLRAHETRHDLVCRLLLEKKKTTKK